MLWLGIIGVVACVLVAYRVGYRRGLAKGAQWLVRPHTRRTLARMPLPEQAEPTISQATFVRTNLPGSTSQME